jgi:hypothetical protein
MMSANLKLLLEINMLIIIIIIIIIIILVLRRVLH